MPGAETRLHLYTYYRDHFPSELVCDLLGRSWRGEDLLSKRELCIETTDAAYLRWQSVDCPDALRRLFRDKHVEKFHTGAIFCNEPRHKKKGLAMVPELRELVFDIDVNDYEVYGIDANDIESCDEAWPIVEFGMRVVIFVLQNHFGFKNMLLVYSGRRGAHLSVYDARACALTDEARSSIVSFMQPGDKPNESGRLNYSRLINHPGFTDLWNSHILPFWQNFCLKPHKNGGKGVLDSPLDREAFMELFGHKHAKNSITSSGLTGLQLWTKLTDFATASPYSESTWSALKETVLTYVWPKLDANVTKLRNHLNKSVFSIHPKTGRICVPVKVSTAAFKPAMCPTLTDLVMSKKEAVESFKSAVSEFQKFLKRLKASSSENWQPPRVAVDESKVFSLVSRKRGRDNDDEIDARYCYTDKKRYCADTVRVFCAVASESEPSKVKIFFYTVVKEACTSPVLPGYAPPCRANSRFPMKKLLDAVSQATQTPGTEVVIDEAYTAVLFDPRHTDQQTCENRMQRLAPRLQEASELCFLNSTWGETALKAMIKDRVCDVWNVKYVYLT